MSDVFYIMASGQSNMVANLTVPDPTVNDNIKIWNPATNSWEIARIDGSIDPVTGMSSGSNMAWLAAREYQARHGGEVRLIIDCDGGRPIDDWLLTGTRPTDGGRYASLSQQYAAAGAPDIDMFLFAQGEGNHDDKPINRSAINSAAEYAHSISVLFGQLRADKLIDYDTPIVMPELVSIPGQSPKQDRNDVISYLDSDYDPFTLTAYSDMGNIDHVRAGKDDRDALHWNLAGLTFLANSAIDALDGHLSAGPVYVKALAVAEVFGTSDFVRYTLSKEGVQIDLSLGEGQGGHAEGDQFNGVANVIGSIHSDVLYGNGQSNIVYANMRDDTVHGRVGDDFLFGGKGADILQGGKGADQIFGEYGADIIAGGAGNDFLSGGSGRDIFHFQSGHGVDVISDFELSVDRVRLGAHDTYAGLDFAGLSAFIFDDGLGNAVIAHTLDPSGAEAIMLAGIRAVDLTAGDFLL